MKTLPPLSVPASGERNAKRQCLPASRQRRDVA